MRFGASASAALRWLAAWHAERRVSPLAMSGDRRSSLDRQRKVLLALVAARPDTTIEEMRKMLEAQGVMTSYGALWRFVAKEGMSFKVKTVHASEQERPDVRQAREDWCDGQVQLCATKLVFIDETWVKTNMAGARGRSARGSRLIGRIPLNGLMAIVIPRIE